MRDSSRGYKAVQCSALQLTGQVGVLVRCVCHHPAAPLALLQTGQVGRGSSSIASSGAAGSARRARLATPLAAAAAADTPKLLQGLVTFLCAMRGYLLDPVRYNPFDRACVLAVAEVVSGC